MTIEKQVSDKLDEFQKVAHQNQQVIDRNEKKDDSLDNEQIRKICKAETDIMHTSSALVATQKELADLKVKSENQYEEIQKIMCRPAAGAKTEKSAVRQYTEVLNNFYRYGANPIKGSGTNVSCLPNKDIIEISAKTLCQAHFGYNNPVVIKKLADEILGTVEGEFFSLSPVEKAKALFVGSNPDGGYWVEPEKSSMVITREFETSPMRQVADVVTVGTESMTFMVTDNQSASGGWVGELQTRSETATAKVGQEVIQVHEQTAHPQASQKVIDDAFVNIEQIIAEDTAEIFTQTENTAFVEGSGAKQPRGFLSYPEWSTPSTIAGVKGVYERNKLETITSTITADTLTLLDNMLLAIYRPRAVYLMERSTWLPVRLLKDGESRPLIDFTQLKENTSQILLGKPVLFADDMQDATASDNLAIAFGDFKVGYKILDRMGIRTLRDPFTDTPNVIFKSTKRVGGGVTNFQSIKLLKIS